VAREKELEYAHWYMNDPKEFRRWMKHKKRRQAARHSTHLVMKSLNYGEDVIWHLDTKPRFFYW